MAFGVEENPIKYDKLYEALKAEIYKFIFQQKKYQYTSRRKWSNFSQGQIQRIALASLF